MTSPLAKGAPEYTSLAKHLADVLSCADSMLSALAPYVQNISPDLNYTVRRAAIYHDLGKAAEGMQKALKGGSRWNYRHEILSAAILMAADTSEDLFLVIAAILTHHKSLNDLADPIGVNLLPDQQDEFHVIWENRCAELSGNWRWIQDFIKKSDKKHGPTMADALPSSPVELPDIRQFYKNLNQMLKQDSYSGLSRESLPFIVARGLLMAADHLASSGIGNPKAELKGNSLSLREFQDELANHQGSAILEAPTGSGKTRAAIAWALANRRAGERIFYVLPYQASINAMRNTLVDKDNGFGFGDESVGVIHHNALLHEFRRFFDDTPDYETAKDKAKLSMDQSKQFYKPIKIVTPFQILKLLFGCKRFEMGLSEMLGGLVIFDEIHAYDPHVAALIEVALSRLQILGVRYLFMTATFPEFLKEKLNTAVPGMASFGITGRDEWEQGLLNRARHRLSVHDKTLEDMIPDIIDASKDGTVLVVCNRIEQAKAIYSAIENKVSSISILHGGFTVRDRNKKEKALKIEGTREPACQVLVATQVVEVSLDISFSTIFTEIAPVDDLLQRFGRVNRVNEYGGPVDVHVAKQFDDNKVHYIYNLERLRLTAECAPDGMELTPRVESEWVRSVYKDGYLDDEKKKYEDVLAAFTETVNSLRPMQEGRDEDFYDMFNNYSVVPSELLNVYVEEFRNERYLNASQLMMSLHPGKVMALRNDNLIDQVSVDAKREHKVWVVSRHYDPDLGLTNDPPDANIL